MLFELRQYAIRPGKREEFVRIMDERVIPFQKSKGMDILGSFTAEEDESVYVWIRRFRDEEERKSLYAAVYESAEWKQEISPLLPDLMDRESIRVTRMNPTPKSSIQ